MSSKCRNSFYMAAVAVTAMGLTCVSSFAADAAEPMPPSGPSALSEKAVSDLQAQLSASDVPRGTALVDGVSVTAYHVGSGIDVAYPEVTAPTSPSGESESKISGGLDDGHGHPYVLLNSFDQDAIINGSGFLVGVAACSAVPESCVITGAVLAAAQQYLSYNGKCSDDRQLLLPFGGHEAAFRGIDDSWVRCV
jgi:hypothetical protein